MRAARRLGRLVAGSLGYDLVKRKKNHSQLGTHLRIVLNGLDVNCVIDVGANEGQYATQLRKLGYRGRIVSFEPIDDCYSVLEQRSRSDPDWLCLPFALGREDGTQEIRQLGRSVLSSFLRPSRHATEQFGGQAAVRSIQTVEVRRLDNLFSRLVAGIEKPRVFLKLDTQGFDLEVFRGACGCLSRILGLQSELSVIPFYEDMPGYVEALATYRSEGFQPTGFFPISRFGAEYVVGEFDCVMLRRGLKPG